MNTAFIDSIKTAKMLLRQIKDVAHDYTHAERVANNVALLCKSIPEADKELLVMCAWWHDIGRLYNPNHEKLSAKALNEDLKKRGVPYSVRRRAYLAVYKHRWSMHPRTLEGRLLRDADKLDFVSIERWQKCEDADNHRHNLKILKLMPGLRNMFSFQATTALYDERVESFKSFLRAQNVEVEF